MSWRLVLPVLALPLFPVAADAAWSGSAAGSATIAAATMDNATGLTAACAANSNSSPINLTWTRSPDSYISSYLITRTGSASGTSTTIPVPATASTYQDSPPTSTGNTYTYTIQARVQSWTTAQSAATAAHGFTDHGGKCL